jgi:PAS domain-containing protein
MNESLSQIRRQDLDGELHRDVEKSILAGVLEASSDACWCMDFGDPVDLTAPDHEVVRQVFENAPFWRYANPAMAQLYLLEGGQAITDRPVREIFPRNQQNEEFILNLLANGFEVDAAPALDRRYDGVEIYVENDVRAHIEGGRLIRMFGLVRDVGKQRQREVQFQRRLDASLALLSAVDVPLIALSLDQSIEAVNLAAADFFERTSEDCLGQHISALLSAKQTEAWHGKLLALVTDVVAGAPARRLIDEALATWSVLPRADGGAIISISRLSEGDLK